MSVAWNAHFDLLAEADVPGEFTVFPGYEIHSFAHGDYTIVYQDLKRQELLKADSPALTEQLTATAVQPVVANWLQRLDESVPPAKQKEVRDKLDVELKKYAESTQKAIEAQVNKAGEAALVPIFMDKLTEEDMKTIIAYLESPVSTKFQALGPEATNAWAKRVIDATRGSVETGAKNFDTAANRIVGASTGSPIGGKK